MSPDDTGAWIARAPVIETPAGHFAVATLLFTEGPTMTFPGAGASVYHNEAGEALGWDSPGEPDYDPADFLYGDQDHDPDDDHEEDEDPGPTDDIDNISTR